MKKLAHICWTDLTVPNADEVKSFYESVVGFRSEPHDMESDYHDYNMISPQTGECVTGVCHAKGVNADVPPVWLVYFSVEDVAASSARCVELGGEIVAGPRLMGRSNFAVIKDPAGAVCALFEE
jgi:predicted enzyme related to lactoylglutathione lyase